MTQSEYYTECKDIAREIVEECKGAEEDIHDRLHEWIDGHQWTIYTRYHLEILTHSSNENAYFEECGDLPATDFSSLVQVLAFWAFREDVSAELAGALEAYRETHPESGDV